MSKCLFDKQMVYTEDGTIDERARERERERETHCESITVLKLCVKPTPDSIKVRETVQLSQFPTEKKNTKLMPHKVDRLEQKLCTTNDL